MPKVSIVIPTFNHYSLLHQTLFDVYTYCRSSIDEVIVVDDASTDAEPYQGLQWWKKQKLLPIRVLENEENVGFLKSCNAGVRFSTGDIVILLSNDVRVQENIIPRIVDFLHIPKTIVGGKLYSVTTGWNEFDGNIYPYLEGWLLAFNKEDWGRLDGFDELYVPSDFEDIDFSTKAIDKGYTLYSLEGAKIQHLGGASIGFSAEREALTIRNKEKFRKKWIK